MLLNVANILEFADTVKMEDVEELIGRQIDYNTAISDEGLKGNYGVETGRILMENAGNASGLNRVRLQARAAAATGSRMGVTPNSGYRDSTKASSTQTGSRPRAYTAHLNSWSRRVTEVPPFLWGDHSTTSNSLMINTSTRESSRAWGFSTA